MISLKGSAYFVWTPLQSCRQQQSCQKDKFNNSFIEHCIFLFSLTICVFMIYFFLYLDRSRQWPAGKATAVKQHSKSKFKIEAQPSLSPRGFACEYYSKWPKHDNSLVHTYDDWIQRHENNSYSCSARLNKKWTCWAQNRVRPSP